MQMPVETFLTALYTLVDDWYQAHAPKLLVGKVGAKPQFSDSEVLTLALAQHWLGFPTEREWLRYVRPQYRPLFPRLLSQSEFNRRARNLCWLLNRLRAWLLQQWGVRAAPYRLIDSTPVPVRHWRRAGRWGRQRSAWPDAQLGWCGAKRQAFYGYRLLRLTTLDGVITDWALLPGAANEREAALDLLTDYRHLRVLGDKGFLDQAGQAQLAELYDVHLFTPKRANQKQQNPRAWDRLMGRVRRRIETLFAQGKAFFGLEQPRARTLWGLTSRLIAKLTGLTIAAWINQQQGRSVLALADFSF
jgi:hypothetical protein